MLKKGLAKFGDEVRDAVAKEMEQLHKRSCFRPVKVSEMKPSERKKAQHGFDVYHQEEGHSSEG